jgi:cellulose synthase/poly-beta-1,6-N-acetylglucosamine synthase-like glycosyltransferase
VISDASTDGTDDIVSEFAPRVELLRLPRRGGKTAAENASLPHIRGEIVVNTDATIRIPPDSLGKMLRWFGDPQVGVVSGRDISMAHVEDDANVGESGYVGYEMWIRRLETQLDGIIGASGCFYGIRKHLHQQLVPEALSRDFAAPLVARERGYRSVSAHEAICLVPRTPSLDKEYRRKVRTMTRGLETLFYKRRLLNPFRYGWFAWMLWSHKLIRWLVPWALVAGAVALAAGAVTGAWVRWSMALGVLMVLLGLVGWLWRAAETIPLLRSPAYMVAGFTASFHAWINALRGEMNPIWEPTRRDGSKGD